MPTAKPRGVRNNNPGNIDRSGVAWQGEDRSEAARKREKRFCVFTSPEYGFRALAKVLLTYRNTHKLTTIASIINRWAPPVENDTGSYARQVAEAVGVSTTAKIDVMQPETMFRLVKAIAHHENGGDFYTDDAIRKGIQYAGIRG